jgi:hypothetical protein
MSLRTQRVSRRNFLLAAGAGTAAGAAALVAGKAAPIPSGTGPDRQAGRGYHSTGHINNYYRTAKV